MKNVVQASFQPERARIKIGHPEDNIPLLASNEEYTRRIKNISEHETKNERKVINNARLAASQRSARIREPPEHPQGDAHGGTRGDAQQAGLRGSKCGQWARSQVAR